MPATTLQPASVNANGTPIYEEDLSVIEINVEGLSVRPILVLHGPDDYFVLGDLCSAFDVEHEPIRRLIADNRSTWNPVLCKIATGGGQRRNKVCLPLNKLNDLLEQLSHRVADWEGTFNTTKARIVAAFSQQLAIRGRSLVERRLTPVEQVLRSTLLQEVPVSLEVPMAASIQENAPAPEGGLADLVRTVQTFVAESSQLSGHLGGKLLALERQGIGLQAAVEGLAKMAEDAKEAARKAEQTALAVSRQLGDVKAAIENERVFNQRTLSLTRDYASQMSALRNRMDSQCESLDVKISDLQQNFMQTMQVMTGVPRRSHPYTEQNITKEAVTEYIRFLDEHGHMPEPPEELDGTPRNKYREFYHMMYQSALGRLPSRGHQAQNRIDGLTQAELLSCYNWLYDFAQRSAIGARPVSEQVLP